MTPAEQEMMALLANMDQARVLENRLGGREAMQNMVAKLVDGKWCSITHTLLQALPSTETITMNYDQLFELASRDGGRAVKVLPYEFYSWSLRSKQRWLLKMHGCVKHPGDIVLTREDYLTYNDKKQSLSGLVQSAMLTKHMLFVGFSMDDPNFHTIASTVKKALPTGPTTETEEKTNSCRTTSRQPCFGTSLQLIGNRLHAELWGGSLSFINLLETPHRPQPKDWAVAQRRSEIFLDYL
eukprot:g76835.t1